MSTATKTPVSDAAAITAARITPTFGAVVEGVDFDHLTPAVADRLNQLMAENSVLFFEGVHPTKEQHENFARCFGEPYIYPLSKIFTGTGDIWTEIVDTPDSPPDADSWHTDLTWVQDQPKYAVLTALEVPETGGNTMWADCYAAYEAMSEPMRRLCERLVAVHVLGSTIYDLIESKAGAEAAALVREKFPEVRHPLIRTHPETGRKVLLWAGGTITRLEGLTPRESDLLLGWLTEHINNPNFHLSWHWKPGDLVIWDERSANHRALGNHYPQYRKMRRCTVEGAGQFSGLAEGVGV